MKWKTSEKRMKQKHKTHGRPLQQTTTSKDRISELEDKVEIKGKTKELLIKQHKTCKRNMQELTNSTKRPNLRMMGIEEGEEVQEKGIHNILNTILAENFPNLEKVMPIQVQEASRTPNRLDQSRTTP
jgi:hypothetical protein